MVKRLLFVLAILTLCLSWTPGAEAVAPPSCGYYEYDVSGGHCVYSWCGGSCHATDCVYNNGSEYHSISAGCGVS
jgi:hypothetical protein